MLKDLWGTLYVCVCVCQAKDKFKKYANIAYSSLLTGAFENDFRKFFNMHNLGLSCVYIRKQSAFSVECVCVCSHKGNRNFTQNMLEIFPPWLLLMVNVNIFPSSKCIHNFCRPPTPHCFVFLFIENSLDNIWIAAAAAAAEIDFQFASNCSNIIGITFNPFIYFFY